MELEEIQATWAQMGEKLEHQKKLTDKIILQMTQQRYRAKFSKISIYESIGAAICYVMAFYILVHFGKLDTWYLVLSGIFTVLFLFILPFLVLRSLVNLQGINVANSNYKETLVNFTKAKDRLLWLQRLGIYLNFLLLFSILPVFGKIMGNKDIFMTDSTWVWYVIGMGIFLVFFSKWGYGCYKSITKTAENILQEME
ncbi:MAG: hypothetical protein WBN18_07320 [Flavobacteriaceae bacterium]